MDEAERLCDRLAIIDHGKIIAAGTPAELIKRYCGQNMVEFAVAPPVNGTARELWQSLPGVDSVHEENGLTSLGVREAHQTIPALLDAVEQRGWRLVHLTTRQASLEDVFVHLTGRHLREE